MNELKPEFDASFDGSPTHHFKQVKKAGNVVIYHRTNKMGKTVGFEVFRVKSHTFPTKEGTRSEPSESYPRADRFWKDAFFCTTRERAEARFKELSS